MPPRKNLWMTIEQRITVAPIAANKRVVRRGLWIGLALTDAFCISIAFVLASIFRLGFMSYEQMTNILVVSLPIYFAIAVNSRAYGIGVLQKFWTSSGRTITAFILTMGAVLLTAFFLKASADFSRIIFGAGTILAIIFLFCGRWLMFQLSKYLLDGNPEFPHLSKACWHYSQQSFHLE